MLHVTRQRGTQLTHAAGLGECVEVSRPTKACFHHNLASLEESIVYVCLKLTVVNQTCQLEGLDIHTVRTFVVRVSHQKCHTSLLVQCVCVKMLKLSRGCKNY